MTTPGTSGLLAKRRHVVHRNPDVPKRCWPLAGSELPPPFGKARTPRRASPLVDTDVSTRRGISGSGRGTWMSPQEGGSTVIPGWPRTIGPALGDPREGKPRLCWRHEEERNGVDVGTAGGGPIVSGDAAGG